MDKQDIQDQLDAWRTKLDELKLKAHLLKLEHRDTPDKVMGQLESAYGTAKDKFVELKDAGAVEAAGLGAGFTAAWSAFKEAYKSATDE
ncbi:MAG: hypothetical protein P1V36_18295 [Planctomycetota bacterium]|nr:hypothetical protein [Planctomycetota bacterium]